ncbi:1,4-alpha-glucan branching protein GlgB [Enterovirga sp.]|uniref:1,4-alpha-glucan branching protein GlgB n=1 Tax=Enterovirga sp. TaxID=2026350 RepID=UPI002B57FF96|nr:1,4-alpha-glucan branching protein GlgB [Enterovirga sp.]HMO28985.1 1,4-alpha-glucan branching protein GlgB [Enterovirga sp.]
MTAGPEAVAALLGARHGDPFAVLGPHETAPGTWEIRVLLPGALRVAVLPDEGGEPVPARRLDPAGFFVARLESPRRPSYRLAIDWPGLVRQETRDPYSFGPIPGFEEMARIREAGSDAPRRLLGAQAAEAGGVAGIHFAVWAPHARRASVIGDFNGWDSRRHPMRLRHEAGVWELFIPGLAGGEPYKYELLGADGRLHAKADPLAFAAQHPPATASRVHVAAPHAWRDGAWMAARARGDPVREPVSIYECHLGSWARGAGGRYLTYRELAARLIPYAKDLGFSHIELLPVTEFPFDGSWGYQPVSLFAPTSRFGPPEDFIHFVEAAHEAGLGLLLDWVPGHFPSDPHGLARFDGTHLYEHADPRQGFHPDWGTCIYNYGREEVAAFLLANARFWLERYHLDGLRVDAVASMLYLDYSRRPGEWVPNRFGGHENLAAIDLLRHMNEAVHAAAPGVMTVAEESTSWPGVSHPIAAGGLGFDFKWNMGWMHDTLRFMSQEPAQRRHHHRDLTFGLGYAFSEHFVLPLSHDEVVHGKGSLLGRMPGDRWQKFANLRAYFGFMWGHPGKKLLFMGGEFGQEREWNHDAGLDWHLLEDNFHRGVQVLVRDLNRAFRTLPALYERDTEAEGFEWLVPGDAGNSLLAWLRRGRDKERIVVAVSNFTPTPRESYRIGVPLPGYYREIVNTDGAAYGGSNLGNGGGRHAAGEESHGRPFCLTLTLPPLATLILERVG